MLTIYGKSDENYFIEYWITDMLIDDNIVSFNYNHYTVCYSPTCKGKETFMFAGGFRRSENNVRWLAPFKNFRKRGVLLFGVCAVKRRNMVTSPAGLPNLANNIGLHCYCIVLQFGSWTRMGSVGWRFAVTTCTYKGVLSHWSLTLGSNSLCSRRCLKQMKHEN